MAKPTTGRGQVSNIYFLEATTTKLPVTESDFMYNCQLKHDAFFMLPDQVTLKIH